MVKLLRVDHRLLHGQVVFSWCSQINPNCILVANDQVVNDDVRKAALRLGKPNDVKLVIKNITDSIEAINNGKTDKYDLMIVVNSIDDAVRLARGAEEIRSINLGGTKAKQGTHALSNMVYVTDEEEELLREVIKEGIEVFIQAVPSDPKKIMK
ncbi:PTS sugar transporter subunit IIB [Clostridium nigeriense]|uniref:PTS sugar transporter subunit IIB n=1 Tax=Clostridium nigeriense TaxID=1805470 RepID=UPI003D347590